MVFDAAARGWMGRLADRLGIADLLACEVGGEERVELAVFRAHHASVRGASPLALDLLAHAGIDPDQATWALRPRGAAPGWLCGPVDGRAGRAGARPTTWPDIDREAQDRFLHGGLVLRERVAPAGALGIRLSPGGLEVAARLGRAWLRTWRGVATLASAVSLPETVLAALPGRRLDHVFDHPALRGRGYVVERVARRSPLWLEGGSGWSILFDAAPLAWRPRWAEGAPL